MANANVKSLEITRDAAGEAVMRITVDIPFGIIGKPYFSNRELGDTIVRQTAQMVDANNFTNTLDK